MDPHLLGQIVEPQDQTLSNPLFVLQWTVCVFASSLGADKPFYVIGLLDGRRHAPNALMEIAVSHGGRCQIDIAFRSFHYPDDIWFPG